MKFINTVEGMTVYNESTFERMGRVALLVPTICIFQVTLFAQGKPDVDKIPGGSRDSLHGITIHQEIRFSTNPKQVYETLLSSKRFSECVKKSFDNFSDTSARIDSVVGGAFSLFDGVIFGRILELVPNRRIVEAWRVSNWPPGAYSIARFEFIPDGLGTQLIFDHIGFPEGLKSHLAMGWQQHYWDALKKYLQ
ncbi:MAG TPA: SRPBCC domain-containing protein [Puia sp.]|nr:SRPBCC domain-containing protein [Puia sp.]